MFILNTIKIFKKRNYVFSMLVVASVSLLAPKVWAQNRPPSNVTYGQQTQSAATTPPLELNARHWLVYDALSGQVLNGQGFQDRIPMGEFIRLMAYYLLGSALKTGQIQMQQVVKMAPFVARLQKIPASYPKMLFNLSDTVRIQDLTQALAARSAMDALVVLAHVLASDEKTFIENMNLQAKNFGLKQTHFHALDLENHPEQYTSLQDLSMITQRLLLDFPELQHLFQMKSFHYQGQNYDNQNQLSVADLTPNFQSLLKQSYKDTYSFIASVQRIENTVQHQKRFLIALVHQSDQATKLEEDTLKAMNYGLSQFDTIKVYDAMQTVGRERIWLGQKNYVKIGVTQASYISLPKGSTARLSTVLDRPKHLYAPIEYGQTIGKMRYLNQGKEIINIDIKALENIEQAWWGKRLWDFLLSRFE